MLGRLIRSTTSTGKVLLSAGFILVTATYAIWEHFGQSPRPRMPSIRVRNRSAVSSFPHFTPTLPFRKPVSTSTAASKVVQTESVPPLSQKPSPIANHLQLASKATVSVPSVDRVPAASASARPPVLILSPEAEVAPQVKAVTLDDPVQPEPHYKDGQYTGDSEDIDWGDLQVVAIIKDGRLTDVQFQVYPFERHASLEINGWALPILVDEAIRAQSAKVDIVSQASLTSYGFHDSLTSALKKAKQ